MTLQALRTTRRNDEGPLVGLPFVDAIAAIAAVNGQAGGDPQDLDVVFTLPAAPAGLTQPEPPLVLGALAAPGVPAIQGDVVAGFQVMDLDGGGPGPGAGLAVGLIMRDAKVTLAGGAGVGQITARVSNFGLLNSAPVAAATVRFFLLR